ncbi:MAG: SDR family NAD(P)-dependent oxidoreductase [Planctomycetes bacterium]|nr:SDR family NAD(P)-dependent oxidoreductase [Planctomycetota bacterium]
MAQLTGKLALVTGASSGIGECIARALAAEGARVVLAARRRDKLERLGAELPGSETIELDVRDPQAVAHALRARPFDLAIPNAGLALGIDPVQKGSPADWSEMIDTNIKGVLHVLRAVTPGMIERKRGDIVLIGSVAGRQAYPGGNVYCATKAAVRSLYESLRYDLHDTGIRVSTVDPGMVRTPFSAVRFKGDGERASKVYAGVDYLLPEDIADIVRFVVTRPARVNIGEVVVWSKDQLSAVQVARRL